MKEYKVYGDPTFRFCSLRKKTYFTGKLKNEIFLLQCPVLQSKENYQITE